MKLSKQKCIPCEGGAEPFSKEEAERYLRELDNWTLRENKIEKTFKFRNFINSIKFVNTIADIAESEGHHPDIYIFYDKVNINLSTHAINGLSINDFIIASKIDEKNYI